MTDDKAALGGVDLLDECRCGDYRRDHENGTGRCKMPNDLCHGFKPCTVFRLSRPASEADHFVERVAKLRSRP